MKIFLFLFFIAIISNNQKNESIEIIKCVLSNEKLKNDLNSLKFQIENLIKEGNLSNLISLLKIFSMVEEVKSCFKNPSQSINNEEIVLKKANHEFFDCIYNNYVSSGSVEVIQNCFFSKLKDTERLIFWNNGADTIDQYCRYIFSDNEFVEEICPFLYNFITNYNPW